MVTGGAGFIGSNFVRYVLKHSDDVKVVNVDCLTYAGNLGNLTDIADDPRYVFEKYDICNTDDIVAVCQKHDVDSIVHFAAESHEIDDRRKRRIVVLLRG